MYRNPNVNAYSNPTMVLGLVGLGFWVGLLVVKGTILAGKAVAEDLLERVI